MSDLIIRPLRPADRATWERLWTGYLQLSDQAVTAKVKEVAFDRMMRDARHEPRGMIALQDGTPVGLAHFLIHRMIWSVEDACFLMDLYVDEAAEGQGIARALIDAVKTAAREMGVPSLYWHCSKSNTRARALYDRIAKQTDFLHFEMPS